MTPITQEVQVVITLEVNISESTENIKGFINYAIIEGARDAMQFNGDDELYSIKDNFTIKEEHELYKPE